MTAAQPAIRTAGPLRRRGPDPRLNLSSNELIHPGVTAILDRICAALTPELFRRYPATVETVDALSHCLGITSDRLVVTPGSDAALRLICRYYAGRCGGSGTVLLQDPNYVAWEETAAPHGLRLRRIGGPGVEPAEQGRWLIEAAWSTSSALVAVSVPNGPVGGRLPVRVVDELVRVCRERNHLLVIDGCYQVFSGPLREQVSRAGGPVVVVQSLSKSHALAGARVSVLCADADLVAEIAPGPLEHCVGAPALAAVRIAVEHHDALEPIWAEIAQVRDDAVDELLARGLRPIGTGGNFVTVPVRSNAEAAATTEALSAAGYRIRQLDGDHAAYLRFTVADRATTDRFLTEFHAALSAASSRRR